MSFARAPDMFMALMGDKDMSDPESLIDTDEDETTSKDSNNKTDALSSRSTNSLHNDAVDRTPTPSFFEDIDQFEVNDDDIGEIGVISTNQMIKSALEGFISIKKAKEELTASIDNKVQLEKVLERLERRRDNILKYSRTAPF